MCNVYVPQVICSYRRIPIFPTSLLDKVRHFWVSPNMIWKDHSNENLTLSVASDEKECHHCILMMSVEAIYQMIFFL